MAAARSLCVIVVRSADAVRFPRATRRVSWRHWPSSHEPDRPNAIHDRFTVLACDAILIIERCVHPGEGMQQPQVRGILSNQGLGSFSYIHLPWPEGTFYVDAPGNTLISPVDRGLVRAIWVEYLELSGLMNRRRRRILFASLALTVIFIAATARIIVWPTQGMPARVDAIAMLAGPGARLPVAEQLAREQRAPVLVVSQGHLGYGGPCPPAISGVQIICFDPSPADTRGEAEYVAKLARQYKWHSVVLVAAREQATRARLLLGRCYSGSIYVVTAPEAWYRWPYQIAYGWGALFKALFLKRAC